MSCKSVDVIFINKTVEYRCVFRVGTMYAGPPVPLSRSEQDCILQRDDERRTTTNMRAKMRPDAADDV